MKSFMDEEFLLRSKTASELYHGFAEDMPIADFHCHLSPKEMAEDKKWSDMSELWLGSDHYKWRAMRSDGIEERYITGDAPPEEKFAKYAGLMPRLIGNPLYHWTHLELKDISAWMSLSEAKAAGGYGKNAPTGSGVCRRAG